MTDIETVVIGGGPAGAGTAAALASLGREVLLLERNSVPTHKVCGEFLSAEAQHHLAELDVDPRALGAVPVERVALSSGRSLATRDLPFGGLSLSRHRLDQALLDRAERNGAMVMRGAPARSAVRSRTGWNVQVAGSEGAIRCRHLVIATGKSPLRGFEDGRALSSVGLKMHLRVEAGIPESVRRRTLLLFFEQGYAGLQPVGVDTVNLCWLVPSPLAKQLRRNWDAWRAYLVQRAPVLAGIVAGEPLWKQPLSVACPSGAYLHRGAEPIAFRVGDRIAHIPPFTGDGLGIALATAALAAGHIARSESASDFARAVEGQLRRSLNTASVLSRIGRSRAGMVIATGAAACVPRLLDVAVRQTRIPAVANELSLAAVTKGWRWSHGHTI